MSELSYNELRKGNLLYFPFISGNVEVIGINAMYGANDHYFNKLSVMEGINMYYETIEVFKPIPLTEECLIKFGFKYDIETKTYHTPSFYWFSISLYAKDGAGFCIENVQYKFIEHVHQLQNLYFALTGIELQQKNN